MEIFCPFPLVTALSFCDLLNCYLVVHLIEILTLSTPFPQNHVPLKLIY